MKYKLIKYYPGSEHELNQVIDTDFIWNKNGKKIYLENYPNFWEEVEEKNYEIVSFKQNSKIEDLWEALDINCSKFARKSGQRFCTKPYSLEQILNNSLYDIHSVKRLSDGELFTVGDNLNFNNIGKGKLISIDFERCAADKGKGKLCFVNDNKTLGDWWNINQLSHIKDLLFTTEDGVDIFEGENFYYITSNFKICYEITPTKNKHKKEHYNNLINYCNNIKLKFSSKEKAQEYLLLNKPCLSINDIKNNCFMQYHDNMINQLKKLVNERI